MSTPLTDAELEARVALIAGWKMTESPLLDRDNPQKRRLWGVPPNSITGTPIFPPHYASDLNAVVPVMEKEWWWFVEGGRQGRCHAFIDFELGHNKQVEATAPTLARACCLALVAAHEGENKSL